MPGPRLNAAFYADSVAAFLRASDDEVYAPLASPHGYTLAPEQLSAWRLQLPVLRAAVADLAAGAAGAALATLEGAPAAPWIHLEFDIPRLGRRVDAVLVTSTAVIPILFATDAPKSDRRWKPPHADGVRPRVERGNGACTHFRLGNGGWHLFRLWR